MGKLLVLVHTVPPLLGVLDRLGAELLPSVKRMHVLDEPLLERIRQRGSLAPEDAERVSAHVSIAEQVGASAVLVTCSSLSPCIDDVRPLAHIPVLKIDEAMIEKAVADGHRIGVVATNQTTLEPTRQLLQAQAMRTGKKIEVQLVLVDNALPALMVGDGGTHDDLVRRSILRLVEAVDLIVLAQASTARVLDGLSQAERTVPILSSPHLALAQTRAILEEI